MPDFTKHLDRHLNNNSMLLSRLTKQHPSQNERNQKAPVALNICLLIAPILLWLCVWSPHSKISIIVAWIIFVLHATREIKVNNIFSLVSFSW